MCLLFLLVVPEVIPCLVGLGSRLLALAVVFADSREVHLKSLHLARGNKLQNSYSAQDEINSQGNIIDV